MFIYDDDIVTTHLHISRSLLTQLSDVATHHRLLKYYLKYLIYVLLAMRMFLTIIWHMVKIFECKVDYDQPCIKTNPHAQFGKGGIRSMKM